MHGPLNVRFISNTSLNTSKNNGKQRGENSPAYKQEVATYCTKYRRNDITDNTKSCYMK